MAVTVTITVFVIVFVLLTGLAARSGTAVPGFAGAGSGVSVGAGSPAGGGARDGSGLAVGVVGAPANDERNPGFTLAYAAAPKLARKVISAAAPITATYFSNSVARQPSVYSDS